MTDSPDVAAWSLILIWPLAVRDRRGGAAGLRRIGNGIEGRPWRRVERPLHHLRDGAPAADEAITADEYAEYLYFHPFIRRVLYDGDGGAMRLYRRTDITSAELRVRGANGVFSLTARVPRLSLYAFGTGDCVLAVEFAVDGEGAMVTEAGGRRRLCLDDVLALNERLRRAYPPFFTDDGTPGYQMDGVVWRGADLPAAPPLDFAAAAAEISAGRVPMAAHWRQVLPDLSAEGLEWSQVMDDRIPAMAYAAVPDVTAIDRGDWVRLANFDEAGDAPLPYGEAFLADFESRHCYDRFWSPPDLSCRYLCSGFGFVMVEGRGDGDSTFRRHFRRHYFQIGLLSQFQLAALQSLALRLARAGPREGGESEAAEVLDTLTAFTQAYWFPTLSGQVQGQELTRLWRGHLGVEALHAQVTADAVQANAILNRRIDSRIAASSARLNRVGAIGLAAALATGFLGMNILVPKEVVPWEGWFDGTAWGAFATVFLAFGGALWAAGQLWAARRAPRRPNPVENDTSPYE